jgi:hypothetical protein
MSQLLLLLCDDAAGFPSRALTGWYTLAAHRWYIVGEHWWYIMAAHGWYTMAEHRWYTSGRILTIDEDNLADACPSPA